ncbi:hypothetical protein H4R35_001362 [Dimargaris xerosporica]|nr:hypothetical protein H4R35_001362 [Dimargaris xerosporica]
MPLQARPAYQHLQRCVPKVNRDLDESFSQSSWPSGNDGNDDYAESLDALSVPLPLVNTWQYYEDEYANSVLARFAQHHDLNEVLVNLVTASQVDDNVRTLATPQLYMLMHDIDQRPVQGTDAITRAYNNAGIVSEYLVLLGEDAQQGYDEDVAKYFERACDILHKLVAPYLAEQVHSIVTRYSEQKNQHDSSGPTPYAIFAYSLTQAIATMGLAPTQDDDALVKQTAVKIAFERPEELAHAFVVGLFQSRAKALKESM